MKRKEFVSELRRNLEGLDEDQVDEIVADYNEHFEVGKEKKRSEEEICESLGDPSKIAKQLSRKQKVEDVEKKVQVAKKEPNPRNIARAVFASAALGAFNIIFVLGPVLAFYSVVFSLCVAAVSVIVAGISMSFISFASLFLPYSVHQIHPLVVVFIGLGIACFGFLWSIGMYYVVKFTFIGTVKYLQFNINLINPKNE